MAKNKVFSLIMALVLIFCCGVTVANADGSIGNTYSSGDMLIIFEDGTSDFVKEKIIADFTADEDAGVAPCGLICTLFGHKLETGTTTIVTHKVQKTAPRCLQEKFNYETCSRCDYSEYTLINSKYIVCCS